MASNGGRGLEGDLRGGGKKMHIAEDLVGGEARYGER